MKKNKIIKIINILIIMIVVLAMLSSIVNASWVEQVKPEDNGDAKHAMGVIIGIFQTVAVAVATIMLIALAIKYMSSAPSEKAEIKKHAVVYIVGAVFIFGSAGIVGLIQKFIQDTM